MDTDLKLYPAQQEGVTRFLGSRGRFVFTYGTGCGKTPTAIASMCAFLGRRMTLPALVRARILVVCPAIVRRHWVHEFKRWASLDAYPIEMGRTRKSGTKKAIALRDLAYEANIQVVSYDLLPNVSARGWDFVVLDEVHHLSDPQSKQSRFVAALLRANEGVPCIALSATLIPTQVKQLWHPMYLLFGNTWGSPSRTGGISWDFLSKYCELTKNEYGTAVGPGKAAKMPELRAKLLKVCHRVTREDIANDLPPLDVKLLDVPGTKLGTSHLTIAGPAPMVRSEVNVALDWFESLPEDITHAVVLVYHRALAQQIRRVLERKAKGVHIESIDGSMPTVARLECLDRIEMAPRGLLVATSEAIREGVRLMWAQKVLYAEWRQSPAAVVQVLGRFQSVGDTRRPQVEVLTDESLYGQACKLMERVRDINKLVKAGAAESAVEAVFAPQELTEERMTQLTLSMLASGPRDLDPSWLEETEENEDGW